MARLAGKVALITGGESSIGLATARLFVSEGARVHLVGLDGGKLDAAVADLGEEHALATVADVTDEPAVVRAIAEGAGRYGRFDVLFSNAGISGAVAAIGEYPSDEFARTLAVHVLGAFHVLKHGAPHVPDGGSIIITSSVVGLMGFEGISGYIAAKHGQVGLMRAAAREYASRRIRVNTLHPGPTSTAFLACTTAAPCPSGRCVHRARRRIKVHGSGCGTVPRSGESDSRTVRLQLVSARSCEPAATG